MSRTLTLHCDVVNADEITFNAHDDTMTVEINGEEVVLTVKDIEDLIDWATAWINRVNAAPDDSEGAE